jgi:hypothetical protein
LCIDVSSSVRFCIRTLRVLYALVSSKRSAPPSVIRALKLTPSVFVLLDLHRYADSVRVASFAKERAGYREWAMKTGRLSPSLEDRFEHDVDS